METASPLNPRSFAAKNYASTGSDSTNGVLTSDRIERMLDQVSYSLSKRLCLGNLFGGIFQFQLKGNKILVSEIETTGVLTLV